MSEKMDLEKENFQAQVDGERLRMEAAEKAGENLAEGTVEAYEAIEHGVAGTYKAIEHGVVDTYKTIEDGVVGGFNKISDKFVDAFLKKEGSGHIWYSIQGRRCWTPSCWP